MHDKAQADYLASLPSALARRLAAVNAAGMAALSRYLGSGEAVAFLGAGASAPLYPLWDAVISELIDAAVERNLDDDVAATCRSQAKARPDAVVELLRRHLGRTHYQATLRQVFRVRRDPETGRTWTATQELVCRCAFKAVVTTNYDTGIVNARMRARPHASGTGFASWTDDLALDRWRTCEVFGDDELPVLFAHGHHNQPDSMVLATTEYQRAYSGKLSKVLAGMIDSWHLVWIGFSFTDQRLLGLLKEVAHHSGTRTQPGAQARHVAIMAWDPDSGCDPATLQRLTEIEYGADVVLYPALGNDHSALQLLLSRFASPSYLPVPAQGQPTVVTPAKDRAVHEADSQVGDGQVDDNQIDQDQSTSRPGIHVLWTPAAEVIDHFTGRSEELASLHRWAADPEVRLIGVTAWGGAGKTALVTHWLEHHDGAGMRTGVRGVFGWSFYTDPSAESWARALLDWAARKLGVKVTSGERLGAAVLELLARVPVVLVLDGLEVAQEGLDGEFGRLLDGTLREVLTGVCRTEHQGLAILTSRFPFADLEYFDGASARMLDVPPFTPTEGVTLLAASGGGWLPESNRRDLVTGVDGHALAVAVLGAALADRPPTAELIKLQSELTEAAGTNARVTRVLHFYTDRLPAAYRYFIAALSLFARPVTPETVLAVADHDAFGGQLSSWTPQHVESAAKEKLAGLVSCHPDGALSAHPLVRDAFRPLALGAAEIAAGTTLTGVPHGPITSLEHGQRVVEAVELLVAGNRWYDADDLYSKRSNNGLAWLDLPAVRWGYRGALAFVNAQSQRRIQARIASYRPVLTSDRLASYLHMAGRLALHAGDLATAREHLEAAVSYFDDLKMGRQQSISTQYLIECLSHQGEIAEALLQAADAVKRAADLDDPERAIHALAQQATVMMAAGETRLAEARFLDADRLEYWRSRGRNHLHSVRGISWGTFLAITGRTRPAWELANRNRVICVRRKWTDDVARCDQLLGRLELNTGSVTAAATRLASAANTFRHGDLVIDLAETLVLLVPRHETLAL